MSMWEFNSAIAGYVEAHTTDKGISASDEDMLWAAVQEKMGRVQ